MTNKSPVALSKPFSPHDPDHLHLPFEERIKLRRADPAMCKVEDTLLCLGGRLVALLPDLYADLLVERGRTFPNDTVKKARSTGTHVHTKVARLWLKRRSHGFSIVTGWALADDGVWRTSSWGFEKGSVVETTVKHTAYYGVVLDRRHSIAFAATNSPAEFWRAVADILHEGEVRTLPEE